MRGFKHFSSIGGHFFELKRKASWHKAYFIPQFQIMQVKTYHAKTNVEHRGTKQQKKHYFLCCKDPGGYFTTSILSHEICSIFKMHHIMSKLGFCFVFSFIFFLWPVLF